MIGFIMYCIYIMFMDYIYAYIIMLFLDNFTLCKKNNNSLLKDNTKSAFYFLCLRLLIYFSNSPIKCYCNFASNV